MLKITEIAMTFGPKLLFTDVNLNLNEGNSYGLVGANGAGKTTFLKVIAGEEEPCFGEICPSKNSTIGILSQDQFKFEDTNVIDVVIAGKKTLWEAMQEKDRILKCGIFDEKNGYRLGELEEIIMQNDGYVAITNASEILIGLGVKEEYHDKPLSFLSGGYKIRVLLAQSLFDNPDILMLDEPTNHLDIPSIYWLESYLKNKFKGILIFISHDIAFINNIANYILDIDYGEIRQYTGNYKDFILQKQAVIEQKTHQLRSQEKYIARMKDFIERFRASATKSRQALS